MDIAFACPSCGVTGAADSRFIGKTARCKHCGYRFEIRSPDDTTPDIYSLQQAPGTALVEQSPPDAEASVFVSRRSREVPARTPSRGARRASHLINPGPARTRGPILAPRPWMIQLGVAALLALVPIYFFVPGGRLVVACALMALGSAMVLACYIAGAYGAFVEDTLYGLLYLVFPLYTGYYIATRWEDLWPWFACASGGLLLILGGAELARLEGIVAAG